jgi:hypothetical protein
LVERHDYKLPEELSHSMSLVEVHFQAFLLAESRLLANGARKYLRQMMSVPKKNILDKGGLITKIIIASISF